MISDLFLKKKERDSDKLSNSEIKFSEAGYQFIGDHIYQSLDINFLLLYSNLGDTLNRFSNMGDSCSFLGIF